MVYDKITQYRNGVATGSYTSVNLTASYTQSLGKSFDKLDSAANEALQRAAAEKENLLNKLDNYKNLIKFLTNFSGLNVRFDNNLGLNDEYLNNPELIKESKNSGFLKACKYSAITAIPFGIFGLTSAIESGLVLYGIVFLGSMFISIPIAANRVNGEFKTIIDDIKSFKLEREYRIADKINQLLEESKSENSDENIALSIKEIIDKEFHVTENSVAKYKINDDGTITNLSTNLLTSQAKVQTKSQTITKTKEVKKSWNLWGKFKKFIKWNLIILFSLIFSTISFLMLYIYITMASHKSMYSIIDYSDIRDSKLSKVKTEKYYQKNMDKIEMEVKEYINFHDVFTFAITKGITGNKVYYEDLLQNDINRGEGFHSLLEEFNLSEYKNYFPIFYGRKITSLEAAEVFFKQAIFINPYNHIDAQSLKNIILNLGSTDGGYSKKLAKFLEEYLFSNNDRVTEIKKLKETDNFDIAKVLKENNQISALKVWQHQN